MRSVRRKNNTEDQKKKRDQGEEEEEYDYDGKKTWKLERQDNRKSCFSYF